jgi:hypothetical protein
MAAGYRPAADVPNVRDHEPGRHKFASPSVPGSSDFCNAEFVDGA